VPGQHLHVAERSADRGYLPGRVGDEGAPAAVAGAAYEPEVPVPSLEHVDDCLRRSAQRAFRADDEGAGKWEHLFPILDECVPDLVVQGYHPSRLSFAGRVLQADGPSYLALGVVGHPPSQPGDLLGPQAGLGRQEEDDPVPDRVSRLCQVTQDGLDLTLAQRLRLFAQRHSIPPNRLFIGGRRWTIISPDLAYMPPRPVLSVNWLVDREKRGPSRIVARGRGRP
jgi:hypothetical protein